MKKKKGFSFTVNVPAKALKSCECKQINCGSGVYGLGFIGSAIYFISTAGSFWMGVLGVLKAIVWPAFLVYGLLKFLGM